MIVFTPTDYEAKSMGKLGDSAIVTGMGKLAMLHACYEHKDKMVNSLEPVILIGYCGLLKGELAIGNSVTPAVYVDGDYNSYPVEDSIHFIVEKKNAVAVCISQDRILTNNPYKDICADFKIAITDMESYAFVEFCRRFKIRYKVIRVVSDIVGEESAVDFMEACKTNRLELALEKAL